jgi:hypothetical protein
MSLVTIVLRFIFGVVLAGALTIPLGLSLPLTIIFVLTVGTVAAVWGDKFILGFMRLMRYFRC